MSETTEALGRQAERVAEIRARWSNGPTGRYGTETERRDQADVEFLLAVADAARGARRHAWDEGWRAAQQVVELDGVKCWAHTVFPEGYEGNPYQSEPTT